MGARHIIPHRLKRSGTLPPCPSPNCAHAILPPDRAGLNEREAPGKVVAARPP